LDYEPFPIFDTDAIAISCLVDEAREVGYCVAAAPWR